MRRRAWVGSIAAVAGLVAVAVAASGRRAATVRPEAARIEIERALQARQWARAEALLDLAKASLTPGADEAFLRARALHGQGKSDAALARLATIPETSKAAPQARFLAGRIARERGRLRDAEANLLAALRLDPALTPARRELVYVYGMQARREALNAQFLALWEAGPLTRDEAFLWTTSLQDVWVNPAIRPDLERFLAADPGDRWSRLALAEVLLRAGLHDEAEAALRPLDPDDPDALALRARLALERSRLDEADALLKRGPTDHARLARLRGELATRRRDWPAAERELALALRLDPTSLQAAQGLALALKSVGKEAQAVEARERAARLRALAALLESAHSAEGGRDRSTARRLGAACEAVGRPAEARAWYGLAVSRDPLDAEAQRALFRLRGGPA